MYMAATNDITGDSIQSRILSSDGRNNWDTIFRKKTALEWLKELKLDLDISDEIVYNIERTTSETQISKLEFYKHIQQDIT
jgi:hypothetical protein